MARSNRAEFFRDSVFRFSIEPQSNREDGEPGGPTHKASISFTVDELDWLDGYCWEARRNGWHNATRSTLVRALIHAFGNRSIPLDGVRNEEQLFDAVRRALAEPETGTPTDSMDTPTPISSVSHDSTRGMPPGPEPVTARIRTLPTGSKRLRTRLKGNDAAIETGDGQLRLD